jgi:hypothetical protein
MAAKDFTLSIDDLNNKFIYKDAKLLHKVDKYRHKAGTVAGSLSKDGYRRTQVNGKMYLVHRIIYFMHYGVLPEVVDHIDGNGDNNSLSNLRSATLSQNSQNRKISKANRSGFKGVFWQTSVKKWRAECNGKYLGLFLNIEDAVECVKRYRNESHLGYCNHGISCTN